MRAITVSEQERQWDKRCRVQVRGLGLFNSRKIMLELDVLALLTALKSISPISSYTTSSCVLHNCVVAVFVMRTAPLKANKQTKQLNMHMGTFLSNLKQTDRHRHQRTHMYTNACTHTHQQTDTHTHTRTYAQTHQHTHERMHTLTHTYTRAYTHTSTLTHIQTNTHDTEETAWLVVVVL